MEISDDKKGKNQQEGKHQTRIFENKQRKVKKHLEAQKLDIMETEWESWPRIGYDVCGYF